MIKTLFVDNLKNTKMISCPKCKKEIEVNMEDSEFFCEECGESFGLESANIFSEDFVWHPSEKY
jgi:transcription initiation factor IIE alpha subunit